MSEGLKRLDEILQPQAATGSDLDRLLSGNAKEAAEEPKGKARLNREIQVLDDQNRRLGDQNRRLQRFVKILAGVIGFLLVLFGAASLRYQGLKARMFRRAFEVLHFREERTLQANAIVLSDYAKGLSKIQDEIQALSTITEDERQLRLKALGSTISQAEALKEGFLRMIRDNQRERGKGVTFEYKDPFLKRTINFDDEMGGEVNLDKLREEVKNATKMDEAMRELRTAMLDPIPMAAQMAAEAKRQNAPVVDEKGNVLPRAMEPGVNPSLQLPGLNPGTQPRK